jgi:hypothetical protein
MTDKRIVRLTFGAAGAVATMNRRLFYLSLSLTRLALSYLPS